MSENEEHVKKQDTGEDISETAEQQPEESVETGEQPDDDYQQREREELVGLLREKDEVIEEIEQQLNEAKEGLLRRAAELDNVKKRVKRERSQVYEAARASALEDFLPVNDDLQRTLKAFEDADVNENFLDGVRLIAEKFEDVLNKYGVERIDQEMVPFDVELHDAMMRQKPEDDSIGSDVVLQVLENGYRMGDRTIRHAKVIVSE